jgi:streptogrisin C
MIDRVHKSLIVAFVLSAAACATDPEPDGRVPDPMQLALQRDLHETPAQLDHRLRAEAVAARLAPALHDELADAYGGAWMSDDGDHLIVGITDPALADLVRDAGAEPRAVAQSLQQLETLKASLDQQAPAASVHTWYVDVPHNRVVVEADDALAAAAFADPRAVTIIERAERPRPLYDIRGGDEYILGGNILCSVGFAVNGGFVSAGHCGKPGTQTAGSNWVAQGTVAASIFPTHDYSYIQINASWTSLPWVGDHNGGQIAVQGSQDAAIGSSVCRSGRTSGWHCGVIQARDVTVNYSAGPVYNTTQTSACAEGGDSGGSFISGNQAQGVTSGGSGNCTNGGTTFFQPVNPILSAYGLTLKTTGGSTREIVSQWNGKCIDVPGSKFVDGAHLQMWDCNGTGAQKWTFTGGTVQAGGKCMDVAWASKDDGAVIQLANCSGNLAQQFVLTGAGDLVSVLANKCVDIKDWNGGSGAALQTWSCAGTANQKWYAR